MSAGPAGTVESPDSERPLVSVVIPTLNEEASICACLDSVLAQRWRNIEVLVVDGGSTDLTAEVVADYAAVDARVRWIPNPRRIQSAAMNTATREVRSPWLVRVDAHSTVPPDYVDTVMSHLVSGNWGGVGGRKDGVAHTEQGHAIVAALGSRFGVGNSTYHHGTEPQAVDHIPFGAYPVEVIDDVGGWDESILANEDFEFDFRVRQSGRELLFDPAALILWQVRPTIREFFSQYRRYGRGKTQVLRKHPQSASPRHLIPAGLVAVLAVALAASPFRPRWAVAVVLPYMAAIGAATAATAPTVSDPGARRWLPAAFVSMHVGYGLGMWESLWPVRQRR